MMFRLFLSEAKIDSDISLFCSSPEIFVDVSAVLARGGDYAAL